MKIEDVKLWTALITPFDTDKNVDIVSFEQLIKNQVQAGVRGLLLFGSTGEAATLTRDEMELLAEKTMAHKGDALVMMGVTHNNTVIALEKLKEAESWGADVVLIAPPYYNRPTQEGLYQHFKALSEASSLPIVLYNIPARVSVNMSFELINRLSSLPNVIGIKEASADLPLASQIHASGELSVWSGDDSLILPYMSIGGVGSISVCSNLFPAEYLAMIEAFASGEIKKASEKTAGLSGFYPIVFAESNPLGIKAAMSIKGLIQNELRLPLVPMSEQNTTRMEKFLSSQSLSCTEQS